MALWVELPWVHWPHLLPANDHPQQSLNALCARASHLRNLSQGEEVTDINGLLNDALCFNAQLQTWEQSLPANYRPERIESEVSSSDRWAQYESYYDFYPKPEVAETWNRYRCARIMMQAAIRNCYSMQKHSGPSGRSTASDYVIQELVDDICASVPYLLVVVKPSQEDEGRLDTRALSSPQGGSLPVEVMQRLSICVGSWELLGHLRFVDGQNLKLRPGQRKWIRDKIDWIYAFYALCDNTAISAIT
jgi:hypothetical protein